MLRIDGTWLLVTLNAGPPDATFALTAVQQKAVAFDPAIALAIR